MLVKKIQLNNFRNWENLELNLSQKVLIYGPNAFGKTNILEALYILATTRSFRGKDAETINLKKDFAKIFGEIIKDDKEVLTQILYKKTAEGTSREYKINEKPKSAIDFIGEFAAIIFVPDDLNLIVSPPEEKRRYLSFTIGQRDKEYLYFLLNYKRILRHRNEILKKGDLGIIKEEIDIWDNSLADYGQKIIEKRKELADFINQRLNDYYQDLSGERKELIFVYKPSFCGGDLKKALLGSREKDIKEKTTTVGPHRDSWDIEIEEGRAYKFISRGELRTIILALKICERDWFLAHKSEKPVILLDDVFSELDLRRRRYLMRAFSDLQLIITTTDLDHLDEELREGVQIINIEDLKNSPLLQSDHQVTIENSKEVLSG